MKRAFYLLGLSLCLIRLPAFAQDATHASTVAAQQESDERYKRMAADVESLQAANSSLLKKISGLEEELRKVRDDQTRAAASSNVSDDLKKLAERIQEVDKKRENDKEVISEEIKKQIAKLEKALLGNAGGGGGGSGHKTPPVPAVAAPPETGDTSNNLTYTIQDRDTLGTIVPGLNEDFKKKGLKTITRKQVMDLNPNVNWNRLLIGQKILIPKPGPAN